MARTRKIMLTITTAIMLFCTVLLGIIHINFNPTSALAESPTVTCQGIANDMNNNILEASTPAKYRTLLAYNAVLGNAANATNVVSTTGEGIKLNGVKLSEIPDTSIDYAHGNYYIQIKIPQSYQDALAGNVLLEVVAGTTFENQVLDASKFILRAGKWVPYTEPKAVEYTGIQWNDIDYGQFGGKNGVLLQFSAHLSTIPNEYNGGIQSVNLASTIGEHIYLGGEKLSTLPGALVAYHSQNFLFIYADNMTSFRTLTVEEGTVALDSILPEINLYYGVNKWSTTPINYTPVTFTSIQWNNIGFGSFEGKNGVLLLYSANLSIISNEYNGGVQTVNLVNTAIGGKIKLGGVALKNIAGAEINYHSQGHLWIYAPNMTTLGDITIESANFLDVTLPKMGLTFNGSAWELCEVPADPTVICQGIANDMNNNILESGTPAKYRTLLAYNTTLGAVGNSTNVVSTTGKGIKLNGVKLSEIPDASIDYGHGSRYIQIRIPQSYQDALMGDIILEVVAGTTFENQVLDASKFVLRAGMWVPYVEPAAVEFTGIQWNDIGFGAFEGKNGVLLQFSANLSTVANEINGSIQSVNFASSVGEHIYLGGVKLSTLSGALVAYHSQNFMFIYADNMSSYGTLTIDEGTVICDSKLPAITLYYGPEKWAVGTAPEESLGEPTFSEPTAANIGEWGWNHKTDNTAVIKNTDYGYTIVSAWAMAESSVNLAATNNLTSKSIKLNGVSFYDLYQQDDGYRLNAQLAYFAFSVPTSALVASNGYEYPTIEIANGTPFYAGNYLPETTLVYKYGAWQLDDKLSFVSIDSSFNNDVNGFFIAKFDTNAWEQAAVPTSYTGITYNGADISDLASVKFYLTHSLWFAYTPSSAKLVAGYNGYSHPTIAIAEGATVVYNGATFTFNAVTFYLNFTTNKWQTEMPDGYVEGDITSFLSINQAYNNDQTLVSGYSCTLLQFSGELGAYTGENLAGTLGANITVGGTPLSNVAGAVVQVGYNGSYTDHLWIQVPTSALVINSTSKVVEMTITTCSFADVIIGDVTLYLIDGAWRTVLIPGLGTPNCDFTGFTFWNNENGATLFVFNNFLNVPTDTGSVLETTGYYIRLNGKRLTEVPGANVYTWMGNCWLRIDIPNLAEGDILTIEEGTPFAGNYLPKLAFKLIDGVWCKAFTVNMEIGSETFTVYSKDDVPVFIDDAYFEELLAEYSIPAKVVSFTIRGVTYEAGTTFKVLKDTDITVNAIGFNTEEGASVRLNTPTGIRFETHINKADYDRLIEVYGEANVETGTYIVPKSLLANTDFRTYFANGDKIDGTDYVKIVNNGFANRLTAETDGYYQYYGSLVEIQPNNYCTEFFGIGYIKIVDGENVYVVFGGYDLEEHTRSIYYVSSKAYKDYQSGSTQKNALKAYLDSVVYITDDAKVSSIMDIAGYTTPYSVSYDAQTGVYTVTGNAEIKSVIIGGDKRISFRTNTLVVGGIEYYVTDYNLNASENYSTLTFKLASVVEAGSLVDFTLEMPSNYGMKILQITDTELMDAMQMRTAGSLSAALQEEYARKNIYANCFNYITELVERDCPDLIILTGDMVNGIFDDNGAMWLRLIEFMDSLNIPWAPVFGGLDNESAKGAAWQRAQLASAQNVLFKDGSVTGNGDYTIGITDNGVLRRVIFMLDSNAGAGINSTQVNWMKSVMAEIKSHYGNVPAFVCYNTESAIDYTADFAAANVDGVFMGNSPNNNDSALSNGIYYTYGTKTGSYGEHSEDMVGGTYITVNADGLTFTVSAECLDKTEMKNKESIHLIDTYDGSSVVTDAYLAPIWETNRIYDETGLFVGETGSVTLMYTPTDPKEVVIRDITLGVTYTYGIDYTISGNKVTRVAGGHLPYMSYDEYYRLEPVYVDGDPKGFPVTPVDGKGEDGYVIDGDRYLFFSEGFLGAERYVTFTYNKTEEWTGTKITGDANAQSFINKLKTDKEATIFFYGDSITAGCNASGTQWGDFRNPFLPAWNDLVTNALAKMYGANITKYNGAVGGWTTGQGAENLTAKVAENGTSLAEIDLFVIAFGMNDPATSEESYIASIKQMIDAYYAANPNGSVLLVSPMQPQTQSSLVSGNQKLWENALNTIKNSNEYSGKNISLAKVHTMFTELVSVAGKLTRDYLGNNINHPNDFGVRLYAQVVLKTLCGDDFS